MAYLRETAKTRELTTLASLHQVNIAREFGEQFIALKQGDVVFAGSREELTSDVLERIYGDIETDELREETETEAASEAIPEADMGIGVES